MVPPFAFQSESGEAPPSAVIEVDDRLTAEDALRRVRRGEWLWHRGTWHNARQLLAAMGRRLKRPAPAATALEAFRQERRARQLEHETLSRILVGLDARWGLLLQKAPGLAEACQAAWGSPSGQLTLTPLKTLLGLQGAWEWHRKGLEVPLLRGRLHPAFGVYTPTRTDYVELFAHVAGVRGATVFDVGTGTGVLSFVLLQRGAARVVATDVEPRAVACARDNAARLGLSNRVLVEERSLFPPGRADLVVCNPPWVPEPPKNRFDVAVFDEGSAFVLGFLSGLAEHLTPAGRGLLVISDLAVHLGLRPAGWLEVAVAEAGLAVSRRWSTTPSHARARDRSDPLHAARSREVTTLYELVVAAP
ncbi:MAG: class I SAM-dependent methyltransferase [Myxococcaceae bacterium]|nr:class I SAM-dependent methyltransferase [Myxococcaceae bacterium]